MIYAYLFNIIKWSILPYRFYSSKILQLHLLYYVPSVLNSKYKLVRVDNFESMFSYVLPTVNNNNKNNIISP